MEQNVTKQINRKFGSAKITMSSVTSYSEPQPQNRLQLNDFVVSVGGV